MEMQLTEHQAELLQVLEGTQDTLEKLGFKDAVNTAIDPKTLLVKITIKYSSDTVREYVYHLEHAAYFLAGVTSGFGLAVGRA